MLQGVQSSNFFLVVITCTGGSDLGILSHVGVLSAPHSLPKHSHIAHRVPSSNNALFLPGESSVERGWEYMSRDMGFPAMWHFDMCRLR